MGSTFLLKSPLNPCTGPIFCRFPASFISKKSKPTMETLMYTDILSIGMVVTIGLMAGTAIGLVIGYLAGWQKPLWSDMTPREKVRNTLLVLACSAVCIAGLAWRFLL